MIHWKQSLRQRFCTPIMHVVCEAQLFLFSGGFIYTYLSLYTSTRLRFKIDDHSNGLK